MTCDTRGSISSSRPSVESLLASVHTRWLDQVRRFVEPATLTTAGFWDRWSATRYLGDQFLDHFRLERAFLASIGYLLDAAEAVRLTERAERIEIIRDSLDQEGRLRGTGAAVARRFVADLLRRVEP